MVRVWWLLLDCRPEVLALTFLMWSSFMSITLAVPMSQQPSSPCNVSETPRIPNAISEKIEMKPAGNYKVVYRCLAGYKRHGGRKVVCKLDGKWGRVRLSCSSRECQPRSDPVYGFRTTSLDNLTETFTCQTNFFITGGNRISTCQPSSDNPDVWTWNSTKPMCQPYGIGCLPVTMDEEEARIADPPDNVTVEYGSQMTVTCPYGTRHIGRPRRRCLGNGRWNDTAPRCIRTSGTCVKPGVPDGGVKFGTSYVYNIGDTIHFRCLEDPVLVGSIQRQCLPNKMWSGQQPVCDAPDVDDLELAGRLWRRLVDEWSEETISSVLLQEKISHERNQSLHLSLGHEGGYDMRTRAPSDRYDGVDLYVLLDYTVLQSSSNFTLVLAKTLVERLGPTSVGNIRGTKVSVVTFGGDYDILLHTNTSDNLAQIENILDTASSSAGGTGRMEVALRGLHAAILSSNTSDRRAKLVAVIITDRAIEVASSSVEFAAKLKEAPYDVEVVVIAVGSSSQASDDLNLIVSEPRRRHLIFVHSWHSLSAFNQAFSETVDYSECGHAGNTKLHDPAFVLTRQEAARRAFPWTAAIYRGDGRNVGFVSKLNWNFACGGALVDQKWVITAAHCVYINGERLHHGQLLVRLGTTRRPTQTYPVRHLPATVQTFEVDAVSIHRDYLPESESQENDIALIKLRSPATFTPSVRPICVPKSTGSGLNEGTPTVLVTGWGHVNPVPDIGKMGPLIYDPTMHQLEMQVRTYDECHNSLKLQNLSTSRFVNRKMLCAGVDLPAPAQPGDRGAVDSCRGDSGGPMAIRDEETNRWTLHGIVSSGYSCGMNKFYGFYTKVNAFRGWIRRILEWG